MALIDRFLEEQRIIPQLSQFFQRFKKNGKTWNFRCPVCGDSEKSKLKSRGYIYSKGNSHFYKCHNCGSSLSLFSLIKQYTSEDFFKNYQLQIFKSSKIHTKKENKEKIEKSYLRKQIRKCFLDKCVSIDDLPENHLARKYIEKRMIPENLFSELYYIDDFSELSEFFSNIQKIPDDKRIVIPYYDNNNKLIGLQGRALEKTKLRYVTLKLYEDVPMLYGLHRWNKEKVTFVTEGPIDSLFLPNALAVSGADFMKLENYINKNKTILILDNEPRNSEICKKYLNIIELGYHIVIWDEKIQQKDINDMIISGYSEKEILAIIKQNCYNGIKAKLKFARWKKCS